jgi:predicted CXXCH cytochrome family protein
VRPKDFMRRNHMELIKHQRDLTVRQGIRATSDSLAACIACHVKHDAAGKPIPVNAEGQFCNRCHEYLAVQPDCFGCHSTVPEGPQPANLEQQWPEVFASFQAEPAESTAQPVTVEPSAPAEPVAQPAVTEPVVVEPSVTAEPVVEPVAQPAVIEPPAPAEPTAQPVVAEPVVEPVAQPAPVEQSAPDGAH